MYFKKSGALTALFALAFSGHALADGFYAGLEAGYGTVDIKSQTEQTAQSLTNVTGNSTSYSYDKGTSFGGLLGGYRFNENLAAELNYFKTGNVEATYSGTVTGTPYAAKQSFSASGVGYALVLRPSQSSGFNGLFLKLGGHNSTVKTEASITAGSVSANSTGDKTGNGTLLGIGYDRALTDKLDIRLAYTRYNKLGNVTDANADVYTVGGLLKF